MYDVIGSTTVRIPQENNGFLQEKTVNVNLVKLDVAVDPGVEDHNAQGSGTELAPVEDGGDHVGLDLPGKAGVQDQPAHYKLRGREAIQPPCCYRED